MAGYKSGLIAGLFTGFLSVAIRLSSEYLFEKSLKLPPYPISSAVIVDSVLGGAIIGLFLGASLDWAYDRLPTSNPISKSLILSLLFFGFFEGLGTLVFYSSNPVRHLAVAVPADLPIYLVLALALGYSYDKIRPREAKMIIERASHLGSLDASKPNATKLNKRYSKYSLVIASVSLSGGGLLFAYLYIQNQPNNVFLVSILLIIVGIGIYMYRFAKWTLGLN